MIVVQKLWSSERGRCNARLCASSHVYYLPGWSGSGLSPETHKHTNLPLTMEHLCLRIIMQFKVAWKAERRVTDIMAARRKLLVQKVQILNKLVFLDETPLSLAYPTG